MTLPLRTVLRAAETRQCSIVGETAAFLALSIAEELLRRPRFVGEDEVAVRPTGSVELLGAATDPATALSGLRAIYTRLLSVSRAVPPALRRLEERPVVDLGDWLGLAQAALIPMNRGALVRALGRIYREAEQARGLELPAAPAPPVSAPVVSPLPVVAPAASAPPVSAPVVSSLPVVAPAVAPSSPSSTGGVLEAAPPPVVPALPQVAPAPPPVASSDAWPDEEETTAVDAPAFPIEEEPDEDQTRVRAPVAPRTAAPAVSDAPAASALAAVSDAPAASALAADAWNDLDYVIEDQTCLPPPADLRRLVALSEGATSEAATPIAPEISQAAAEHAEELATSPTVVAEPTHPPPEVEPFEIVWTFTPGAVAPVPPPPVLLAETEGDAWEYSDTPPTSLPRVGTAEVSPSAPTEPAYELPSLDQTQPLDLARHAPVMALNSQRLRPVPVVQSTLEALLEGFAVALPAEEELGLQRGLRQAAGVDLTPLPVPEPPPPDDEPTGTR